MDKIKINERVIVETALLDSDDALNNKDQKVVLITFQNLFEGDERADGDIFKYLNEEDEYVTARVSKETALEMSRALKTLADSL